MANAGGSDVPTYDVVTIVDPPYVLPKNATGQHGGLMVEILDLVAREAGFKYNLSVVSGTYGHQETNGFWAGLIGKLQLSQAQIAVGAIATTSAREYAVKFSRPFQSTGIQLLMSRPHTEPGYSAGMLLMPFTASSWTLIWLAFILVSIGLFLIGRYSPGEWSQVAPEKDVRKARHSFGLRNSFLFAISTFTWQGYRESPKSLSGRVLAVAWWLFTLCVLVAYTSNLTALILARPNTKPALPFRTYEDIVRDRSIDIGIIRSSDADLILGGSSENMANQMYELVKSKHNWVRDLDEGLQRMRQSDGQFALLLPTYKAQYLAQRNCDLITYGNSLDLINYAFAFSMGGHSDPVKTRIDAAILKLKEDAQMHLLVQNWQRKDGFCTETDGSSLPVRRPDRDQGFVAMGPRDLAVPFLFLFLCGILAGLTITLEILVAKGHFNLLQQRPDVEGGTARPFMAKPAPSALEEPAMYAEEAGDLVKGNQAGKKDEEDLVEAELEPEEKEKMMKEKPGTPEASDEYVTISKDEEQEDNKPNE